MTKRLYNDLPKPGECPNCRAKIGTAWKEGHECPECGSTQGVGWH